MSAPQQPDTAQMVSAYRWVIAFTVIGIILFLISKWRVGYTLLYYLAALALFFLIVTQYQAITTLLAPFNTLSGGKSS
jgi:hypothetical protein